MPLPNVTGIFPPFANADHFQQTRPGRWTCTLCSFGLPISFDNEKAALAHEKGERHKMNAELAATPWDGPAPGRSEDWKTDAGKDFLTPDEIKDLEYRQKVSRIPVTVQAWCESFAPYVHKGQMTSVDEPTATPGLKKKKKPKSKSSEASAPSKAGSSEDEQRLQRPSGSTGTQSDDDRKHPHRHPPQLTSFPANRTPTRATLVPNPSESTVYLHHVCHLLIFET